MPKQLSHDIRAWTLKHWFVHEVSFAFWGVGEAPKDADVRWLRWEYRLGWNTQVDSPVAVLEEYKYASLGAALGEFLEILEKLNISRSDGERFQH